MIAIDTSALFAVLHDETEAEDLRAVLKPDERILISTVALHETLVVLLGKRGLESWKSLEALLRDAEIETAPFDETQARIAAEAYAR